MGRMISMVTGQWADLRFDDLLKLVSNIGYDGIDLGFRSDVFDLDKAAKDQSYCDALGEQIASHELTLCAISAHIIGQCVGDRDDPRLDAFVPERYRGKPRDIQRWASESMLKVPHAAKNLGVRVVSGFMGSPIWRYWYSFPKTPQSMVTEGFEFTKALWRPILNEFASCGVTYAFEVHPSEIAYDYYTTQRLIETLDHEAFGLTFDPSHLLWQGVNPSLFVRDFAPHIAHVHLKDVAVNYDGRGSILSSHLPFGDLRRVWNFRTLGHGSVNFEEIIRELNAAKYEGALSVEWEDNGMDRMQGAIESLHYARALDFPHPPADFDSVIRNR